MDKLEEIFDRQRHYLRSLKLIYQYNGFDLHALDPPWNLNGREEQEEFRLLAWRYIEELIEAAAEAQPSKYITEMADALHFLVEIALFADITPQLIYGAPLDGSNWERMFADAERSLPYGRFHGYGDLCTVAIQKIGEAMCLLKQRPWRTDNRLTDWGSFVLAYRTAFFGFVIDCTARRITGQALYQAFFAKAKVNDDRTRSQPV